MVEISIIDPCPRIKFCKGGETGLFGPGWLAYASKEVQAREEPIPAPTRKHPFLVVRIYNAVYQREPIEVRYGKPAVGIHHRGTYVQHPEPFTTDGELSECCRTLLLESVQEAMIRLRFRMCLVWSATSCTYVEASVISHSSEPPSGGLSLPNPIVFDERVRMSEL